MLQSNKGELMNFKRIIKNFILIFGCFMLADFINPIKNDWLTALIAFVFFVIVTAIFKFDI